MPIYEYLLDDGTKVEQIYLAGETAPKVIQLDDGRTGRRVVSVAVIRFDGAFSGGTASRNMVKPDDGREYEPGVKKDIKRKAQYREEKETKERREFLAKELNDYNL